MDVSDRLKQTAAGRAGSDSARPVLLDHADSKEDEDEDEDEEKKKEEEYL